MSQAENDRRMDYVEFLTNSVEGSKKFFTEVFGWEFTDYGPDYTSFNDGRMAGGFRAAERVAEGGTLIVLYAENLEETEARVTAAGGRIAQEIFEFPGGRRFHFVEPGGNELAVWSE